MIDFVLRHGNDMLAVESLKGFEGNLREQGKILRQGDLTVFERHHKHKRRVFLFESTVILAKTKRPKHQPEISGSEVYEFRSAYKVCASMYIPPLLYGVDYRLYLVVEHKPYLVFLTIVLCTLTILHLNYIIILCLCFSLTFRQVILHSTKMYLVIQQDLNCAERRNH